MTDLSSDPRPEFAFIDWVRRRTRGRPEVPLAIGDDAAVLSAPGRQWITAVDVITEGVHFQFAEDFREASLPATTPELAGRKALAINLSDVAAMAGEPVAAFIGIVFPKNRPREFAEAVYDGLLTLADEWNVCIAGGDTNSWEGPLVISVTVLGLTTGRGPVLRSGARPGDWIFVTGALGGSLTNGRHLTFTPRIREALALHERCAMHAMIDLSDGLASDLFHVLDASTTQAGQDVGAVLDAGSIPIHADINAAFAPEERLRQALNDGEDFELLFTVSSDDGRRLLEKPPFETPLTKIGEIVPRTGVVLRRDNTQIPLLRGGWSHSLGARGGVSPPDGLVLSSGTITNSQ